MSVLTGLAALLLAAAAFLGPGARASRAGARILAAAGGLALLPAAWEQEAWSVAVLAGGAVALGTPLPCLLAAAGSALVWLGGGRAGEAPLALALLGLAATLAADALETAAGARLREGADAAWAPVAGGGALCLSMATLDGGRVLIAAFGLGSGTSRLVLPGAGFLLGLTLLCAWGGTLALVAHLLAPAVRGARPAGQRLLVLALGLALLGLGLVVFQGFRERPAALAASATGVAGCLLAAGLLARSLTLLLGPPAKGEPSPLLAEAERAGRLAGVVVVLALGASGVEAWLRQGSYATPLVSATGAVALLGLSALETTQLAVARRALFLSGLVFLLA